MRRARAFCHVLRLPRAARRAAPVALTALLAACAAPEKGRGDDPGPVTPESASAFVEEAESRLLEQWVKTERAAWVKANFISHDTKIMEADSYAELMATTQELATGAARFADLDLTYDVSRKLDRIKLSLPLAAPSDPERRSELASITSEMDGLYGEGKYCAPGGACRDLEELSRVIADSRDPAELLDAWRGWREIAPPMKPMYTRFVELGNEGARELGFADLGAMWRSGYDMEPEEFSAEIERLFEQVRPLYEQLHCYVRARLAERYGTDVVDEAGPIPAHLLGNMWAQGWSSIYDVVAPEDDDSDYDLTRLLRDADVDATGMVRYGERFFTSLGFDPLPDSFWERSLFTKPRDREVVCHASAWDLDMQDDLRIKMCIEIDADEFVTVHHELGHNFYQRAYASQPPLYRDSANDGFHEAIGDTVALSITPEYLVRVGLLDEVPPAERDTGLLLRQALDKVAFLPFGLLIDQWRWRVFNGEIEPEAYNEAWWELRERYQGIVPPVARDANAFDPGAKYHVPANTPYTRYFLAHILQFQFHRALCETANVSGPLHRCSIYESAEAGERLARTLEMGSARPWPDALEALTGQREMDATAILDYFAPLSTWLEGQNEGRTCGW